MWTPEMNRLKLFLETENSSFRSYKPTSNYDSHWRTTAMSRAFLSYRIMREEELKRWKRFQETPRVDERAIFQD